VHPLGGSFNERSVAALKRLCEHVEVLVPRPYVPSVLAGVHSRWKVYAKIPSFELRNAIAVHRPSYLQIPCFGGSFSIDGGAFLWCRKLAARLHCRTRFDAVLSFGLVRAGGIAWKISRDLGIPAGGWATGSDVRAAASSPVGRSVTRAIKKLDVVFYQSRELMAVASKLVGMSLEHNPSYQHMVLSRGVPSPPPLLRSEVRKRVRQELGIADDRVLVMSIGRIHRTKGILELIEAVSIAGDGNPKLCCVIVGSDPPFDETPLVLKRLASTCSQNIRLLPACPSERVWEYLCAADVFAFTSHREGMPNSLLEAMAMGVPAIAFAIPPVLEIEAGTGAICLVPPFEIYGFAQGLLRLAPSPAERRRIGEAGKNQVTTRFMAETNMALALERLACIAGVGSLRRAGRCQFHLSRR
jgi:glycosyltransferase involved in cell wall biosynthesis